MPRYLEQPVRQPVGRTATRGVAARRAGNGAPARRYPPGWLIPTGLAVLPFVVYGRFLFLGDELSNADVFLAYRPAHAWLAEGLRRGHVPLWNPYLLGGFPLAFSEYGWFSPLNWLPLLLFGPHAGFYVAVACYVALAGVMACGLARAWGATVPGATLAGLVYGQSLFVVGGAPLLNQGAAYWALPALLWCADRHVAGRRIAAPALAAVLALTLLGSHPQLAILAGAPAGTYLLWRIVVARRPWLLLPSIGAAALAAAVGAVRYLPTLSLVAASERAGGLAPNAQALGSVSPLALLAGVALPSLRLPLNLVDPQWTAYLGPLPLLLAAAGLRLVGWRVGRRRDVPSPSATKHTGSGRPDARRSGRFVVVLGAAGVLLAFGSFTPAYWALSRTPLLAYFREPSRFLLWTVLAVAVLAAWGLDASTSLASTPAAGRAAGAPRRFGSGPGRWWWPSVVLLVLTTTGLGAVHGALRWNERAILNTGRLRAVTQARPGDDYPTSFYVEGVDAAWRRALRATNPLHPGLLVPLGAFAGTLWWWRWGQTSPSVTGRPGAGPLEGDAPGAGAPGVVSLPGSPEVGAWSWPAGSAIAVSALPLLLYGQVHLPAIPAAVVREAPLSVALTHAAGTAAGFAESALSPRVMAWLPLATDFETRRQAEALDAEADVISYRLLQRFLAPNLGMSYNVPLVDGYENLMTREQALLAGALGSERAGTAGASGPTALSPLPLQARRQRIGERWGLLAATGAGTLISGDRLRPETWPTSVRYERAAVPGADGVPALNVYRVTRPLPRAFLAAEWTVAEDATSALGLLLAAGTPPGPSGFATRVGNGQPPVVVVAAPGREAPAPPRRSPPGRPAAGTAPGEAPGAPDGLAEEGNGFSAARIVRYDERLVEVETEADAESMLVLLDAYAPGWTASVTGAPAPLHLSNVAYRAVPVPAGRHLVRFTYTPPTWPAALWITGSATLVLFLWALRAWWPRPGQG